MCILTDSYGILSICGTSEALPLAAYRVWLNFKYFSTRSNSFRDFMLNSPLLSQFQRPTVMYLL